MAKQREGTWSFRGFGRKIKKSVTKRKCILIIGVGEVVFCIDDVLFTCVLVHWSGRIMIYCLGIEKKGRTFTVEIFSDRREETIDMSKRAEFEVPRVYSRTDYYKH